jgi:hypothetical protein
VAKSAEPKKPVLVRLPMPAHEELLRRSAVETVRRGETVSVPLLIAEYVRQKLEETKGEK